MNPGVRPIWRVRDAVFSGDRTVIMGILNVTPDSFSDGGSFLEPGPAISHGLSLASQGADLVDVGGESARPGASRVDADEELARVLPVVEGLAGMGVRVSIDTTRAAVASRALQAGAVVVNDISGLRDHDMAGVVAASGAGLVLMHMLGEPGAMPSNPDYQDVTAEVGSFLEERAVFAERAGIGREAICLDPGIGFGKSFDHNLTLLRRLDELTGLGYPVLVGTSRKSFLGRLLDEPDPVARDAATGATVALAIAAGALAVRVHNVAVSGQVARVADAIVRSTS